MINPFDSEFLSQELRETWEKVEALEEENKELKEKIKWYEESMDKLVKNKQDLEKEIEELKENEVERLKKKCQEYENEIEFEKKMLPYRFTWPEYLPEYPHPSVTTISEPYISNVTSISQEPEWIGYCSTGIPEK